MYWYLYDDGSDDGTTDILNSFTKDNKHIFVNRENRGLRSVIQTFMSVLSYNHDIIAKIDNDCIVPPDYLVKMLDKFYTTDADILSPNVTPSNASYKYGRDDDSAHGYRPSHIVGGLWMMKREMIDGLEFDYHDVIGIKGAFNILYQIVVEKNPKVGWLTDVVVDDLGHWSGMHPDNIKSEEHLNYYHEVGRSVTW